MKNKIIVIVIIIILILRLCNIKWKENAGNPYSPKQLQESYQIAMNVIEGQIDAILFFGSLLGYYREKNFINRDDDIDILCPMEQIKKAGLLYEKAGIPFEYKHNHSFIRTMIPNKPSFELYGYEFINNNKTIQLPHHLVYKHLKRNYQEYDRNLIFPTKHINYFGYNILIPHKIPELLKYIYGKDYMIPKSDH